MIERSLAEFLLSESSVTNLVGTHVYAGRVPQTKNATIAILLRRVSNLAVDDLAAESDTTQSIVQVDVVARSTNAEVRAFNAAEAVRLLTSAAGYRGVMGTTHQHRVYSITNTNRIMPTPASPVDGSDAWTHRFTADYQISYKQTTE